MKRGPTKTSTPAAQRQDTTLRISVTLTSMPPRERAIARRNAQEWAVIGLWREGQLSTRRAAEELELGYLDFLDLLAAKGVPALTDQLAGEELGNVVDLAKRIREQQEQA